MPVTLNSAILSGVRNNVHILILGAICLSGPATAQDKIERASLFLPVSIELPDAADFPTVRIFCALAGIQMLTDLRVTTENGKYNGTIEIVAVSGEEKAAAIRNTAMSPGIDQRTVIGDSGAEVLLKRINDNKRSEVRCSFGFAENGAGHYEGPVAASFSDRTFDINDNELSPANISSTLNKSLGHEGGGATSTLNTNASPLNALESLIAPKQ